MTDSENSCAVCFEEIVEKFSLKCSHCFCKRCVLEMLKDLLVKLSCPYCRQESMIYEIKSDMDGKFIFQKPSTIVSGTYVQGFTLGLASYHFESIENSYISYESPLCQNWPELDDGSRPAEKKYFVDPKYDTLTRKFTGNIDWSPTSWRNDNLWKYTMFFSEDFMKIESGHCQAFDKNGEPTNEHIFGVNLIYFRMIDDN